MPAPTLTVKVYRSKSLNPNQRWRWRVRGGNHRKLANGGEGYRDTTDLVHALHLLWPAGANEHVVVELPGRPDPVALAALAA